MSKFLTLNTGAKMPIIGLGTWKSEPGKVGQAVECALTQCDYKHIDCAAIYRNEPEIGEAFDKVFSSGQINREDIFVTSKLWNISHAREDVAFACKKTLSDLRLDYLDLYLMHWGIAENNPSNDKNVHGENTLDENGVLVTPKIPVRETWEAMEELVSAGLVKAIGLANFTGPMIVDLLTYAKIKPSVNQIELHLYNQQTRLVQFCQNQGIIMTAYSPLGRPGHVSEDPSLPLLLGEKIVVNLSKKYNKTPAQIVLRWGVQRNTIVIPKSVTPERIKENINIFNFELTSEEVSLMASLDRHYRFVDPFGWWGVPYFD